mmetsp:Transcript_26347/g.62597  ORF Transcript_26347/g.62597 Transcript_26347/m.62597 type:complete len:289 (+) Transcript_26347:338-1204(+)
MLGHPRWSGLLGDRLSQRDVIHLSAVAVSDDRNLHVCPVGRDAHVTPFAVHCHHVLLPIPKGAQVCAGMPCHEVDRGRVAAAPATLHALGLVDGAGPLIAVVVARPDCVHLVLDEEVLKRVAEVLRDGEVRVLRAAVAAADVERAVRPDDEPRSHGAVDAREVLADEPELRRARGERLLGAHLQEVDGAVVKRVPLLPLGGVRHAGPLLVGDPALAAGVENRVEAVAREGVIALVVSRRRHPRDPRGDPFDLVVEDVPLRDKAPEGLRQRDFSPIGAELTIQGLDLGL